MEIAARLSLYGFERKDLGERGAVFVQYETPTSGEDEADIHRQRTWNREMVQYVVTIPRPQARQVAGVVIVERTSKSRYTVSAWAGGKIENFSATSIDEIQNRVNEMQRGKMI